MAQTEDIGSDRDRGTFSLPDDELEARQDAGPLSVNADCPDPRGRILPAGVAVPDWIGRCNPWIGGLPPA
jgi:hypothetical protein